MNIINIKQNIHYVLLSIAFLVFCISISIQSYNYFFNNEFFEGYMLIGQVIVFDILTLPIAIIYLYKKDFINLGYASIFYAILNIIGGIGFKISFALLPITLAIGAVYFYSMFNQNN